MKKQEAEPRRTLGRLLRRTLGRAARIYRDLPIRVKLLAVLGTLMLVPLVLIGYTSYRSSENVIRKNSIQYAQDLLAGIELRLGDSIRNLTTISQNAMTDDRIYTPIAEAARKQNMSDAETLEMGAYLRNIIMNVGEVQSVAIISNGQDYISADNNQTEVHIRGLLPPQSALLAQVRRAAEKGGGQPVFYITSQSGRQHIFFARVLYDEDTYQEIGLMVILVNADYLGSVFQSVENRAMQNLEVVAPLSDSPAQETVILSKQGADVQAPQGGWESLQGNGWRVDRKSNALVVYTRMGSPAWSVVSSVPLRVLYSDIYTLRDRILFSCLAVVIVFALATFLISYDLISSINRIVLGMRRLQQGEDNVRIAVGRKDEIGYLGDTFNGMASEITMLEKWVYREQITRKDAEIKALQSQINPHFLFNTLESINWMAQLDGAPEISETVSALASLMEANISRHDKFVPLQKELDYVDDYMLIMKRRFADHLELVKDVDPGCLSTPVPRLLLQPIVENAVNHGVGNSRGKGVIRLSIRARGGDAVIAVEDNGAGIEPEKLEELNRRLSMDDEAYFESRKGKTGGIGMENVNRRIRLLYGTAYGITVESRLGEFTRVTMTVPLA